MTNPSSTFNQLGSTRPGAIFPRRIEYRSEFAFHWRPQDGWYTHDPTITLLRSLQQDQGRTVRAGLSGATAGLLGFYSPWSEDFPRLEMVDAEALGELTTPTYVSEPATSNLVDDSEDLTQWANAFLPVPAGGFDDPFDGTNLHRLEDDDNFTVQVISETLSSFTADGQKGVSLFMAQGFLPAAGGFRIRLRDTGAAALRLDVLLVFDADGTPTVTSEDTGTFLRAVKVAFVARRQVFRLEFLTTSVTSANAHDIEIVPADVTAETGDVFATGVQVDDAPFVSTYKVTTGASVTGTPDQLVFDFPLDLDFAQKSGGMSILHTFQELGGVQTTDARLWRLGNVAGDATIFEVKERFGKYALINPSGDLSVPDTPAYGIYVEMLTNIDANGRGFISARFAADVTDFKFSAESSASQSPTVSTGLPAAFSAQELHIGGVAGSFGAAIRTLNFKVAAGFLGHDQMRERF